MKTRFSLPVLGLAVVLSASAAEVKSETTTTTTATTAVQTPAPAKNWTVITSSAQELVKMKDAGLEGNVIKAYVESMRVPFKATADDILYLHEHQVSDEVICDWIKKGGQLTQWAAQQPARSPDLVASSAPPVIAQPLVSTQPAAPTVIYQAAPQAAAPTVVYQSPSYAYWDNYYYNPPVYLGFSWGWGRPYYGWGGYYHAPVRVGFGGHYGGHFGGGFGGHGGGGVHVGGSFGGHAGGGGHVGGGFGGGGHHR